MEPLSSPLLLIFLLPFFFAHQECHVISRRDADEKVEKLNLFEGDILLPQKKLAIGRTKRSAVLDDKIWPGAKIPYVISNQFKTFNQTEINIILDVMKAFKSKTCIEFIPRTTEEDYTVIEKNNEGCYSSVGRLGGIQIISLDDDDGCIGPSLLRHELMHTVGFYHEQSRTDRDDYVTIYADNIEPGLEGQFEKKDSETVQLLGTPYDFKSIMHYAWNDFAIDYNKPTVSTSKIGPKIESSGDFSSIDILDINLLYKCPKGSYIEWEEQAWNNGKFVWISDCDSVGTNIVQLQSKREDCGGLCSADLKCTHFTWESNGLCTLKTALKYSTETRPLQGAICGYITEGNSKFKWVDGFGKVKWADACDFPGNDIRTVTTKGTSCSDLCIAEPKCTSYAARSLSDLPGYANDRICFLKSGKSPIARRRIIAKPDMYYCGMISARI